MTRYDAILIGAGMSGLAAAIRLAMFEQRVVVLERHEVWGGLNSFYTLDGHAFDVGLHALTNWSAPGERSTLSRILRQLRIPRDELALGEQTCSRILLPGIDLTFTNDVADLQEEVARAFPKQADRFARLVETVREKPLGETNVSDASGRAFLAEHLSDPRLVEAILLPLVWYGSAREDDVDLAQLLILFRSIFLEGLARPEGGIRPLLNTVVKRLKRSGAELRLRTGVRRVLVEDGVARGVELDDGTTLEAERVFSSAGYVETMRLCGEEHERGLVAPEDRGRLSFVESISVLDTDPRSLGLDAATAFWSTREEPNWRRPDELIDTTTGVLSVPTNFAAEKPPEPLVRVTALAEHDRWCALPEDEYRRQKARARDDVIDAVSSAFPERVHDWRPHAVYDDVFTPRTIRRFTGHDQGAVYGSPRKRRDGETGVERLHLIGTDQGYLGIVGALASGVAMANRHALAPVARGVHREEART